MSLCVECLNGGLPVCSLFRGLSVGHVYLRIFLDHPDRNTKQPGRQMKAINVCIRSPIIGPNARKNVEAGWPRANKDNLRTWKQLLVWNNFLWREFYRKQSYNVLKDVTFTRHWNPGAFHIFPINTFFVLKSLISSRLSIQRVCLKDATFIFSILCIIDMTL